MKTKVATIFKIAAAPIALIVAALSECDKLE